MQLSSHSPCWAGCSLLSIEESFPSSTGQEGQWCCCSLHSLRVNIKEWRRRAHDLCCEVDPFLKSTR